MVFSQGVRSSKVSLLEWAKDSLTSKYELLILVAVVLGTRWNTLSQPLVERHDFRQTQTAFTTLTMANGFGGLFSSKLPLFGSPWELPFEFPLFQYCASLLYRLFELDIDFANRLTALIFFCLCFFPLHSIAGRYMSRLANLLTCGIFAFSPFAIQWSRASLIEYCVLFLGLCFVHYALKFWEDERKVDAFLALVFGSLCGLVKVTTFVPMLVFLLILLINKELFSSKVMKMKGKVLGMSLVMFISLAVAQTWAMFTDHIRATNPATSWMTQSRLNYWTFGSWTQRAQLSNWFAPLDRIDQLILPRYSLMLVLFMGIMIPSIRRVAIASFGAVFVTMSIFFNLYFVHDYYLIALSAFLVIPLGLVTDVALKFLHERRKQNISFVLTVPLLFAWTIGTGHTYWASAYITYPRTPSELMTLSSPNQYAFVSWDGWNPLILYYANRKGMMLDARSTTYEYLRNLPDLDKYDFYAGNADRQDVMRIRGYYSPIGLHVTRIDDNLADFKKFGLAFSSHRLDNKSFKHSATLNCDGAQVFNLRDLPIGTRISTKAIGDPKDFGVSFNLQSVPIGSSIEILSALPANNTGRLVCSGGGTVVLQW